MKKFFILILLLTCEFKNGNKNGIQGVESKINKIRDLWEKPAEGSESGGYLTGKYRTHIEKMIDRIIAKTEINHDISNNQYM